MNLLSLILSVPVLTMLLADPRVIQLPPGETVLHTPLELPSGSGPITIRGNPAGSTLVMSPAFRGSAAILITGAPSVTVSGFSIRGNRTDLKSDWYLPLNEAAFADFYPDNGIVIRNSTHITIRNVNLHSIRAFPLLVHASSFVTLESISIQDSGTLNRAGRNNTTGGILLEEGVAHFTVRASTLRRITGNAIWTHSWARSPRQSDGVIAGNSITTAGRDAIQIGHASRVRVEHNTGSEIGFPADVVDVENHGVGVALDTAGNVDFSTYANNRFTDVNGQCIDLDGFHDGSVIGNSCINSRPPGAYPASHYGIVFGNNDPAATSSQITLIGNTLQGFAYGGIYLLGQHNRIANNRLLDLNRAHCGATPVSALCNYALTEQPDLLRSAIYLAANGGRPAETKDNTILNNTATGFGLQDHCVILGPGVASRANQQAGNQCLNIANLP